MIPHSLVSDLYDELDSFYRRNIGEYIHLGIWKEGNESFQKSRQNLEDLIADKAQIQPGDQVCDVGCGYGVTARRLAKDRKVQVTALTISQKQFDYLSSFQSENPVYILCDWLNNTLLSEQFNSVIAIESFEHMENKEKFLEEAFRVLHPGGRLSMATFLVNSEAPKWKIKRFLKPLCRDWRLFSLGSQSEYTNLISKAGFHDVQFESLILYMKPNWTLSFTRMLRIGKIFFAGALLRNHASSEFKSRVLLARMQLWLWLSSKGNCLEYGIFTAKK